MASRIYLELIDAENGITVKRTIQRGYVGAFWRLYRAANAIRVNAHYCAAACPCEDQFAAVALIDALRWTMFEA